MTPLSICISTLFACVGGSFLPFGSASEIALIVAVAAAPPSFMLPLVIIASAASMVGKSVLYLAGTGAVRLPRGIVAARVQDAHARVQPNQRASGALLFASASTGFPPFYFLSLASGALSIDFRQFLLVGLVGRFVRFGFLAILPGIARHFF